ncbi:MAG: hypothetical protein K8T25_16805 [Planctomycetia bacterium]|nr:hypothetical protein [Planctomycetia bacterium]
MKVQFRFLIPILLIALAMVTCQRANAQVVQPFGPIWDECGHDFTPFAPAEVSSFDGGPDPNEGFFLDYRRMYISVDRPQQSWGPSDGNFTWGNRVSTGYILPENHGWLLELMHIDGPNLTGATVTDPNPLRPFENQGKINSVELSKLWRWQPLHNGGIVESFVGMKVTQLEQWTGLPAGEDPTVGLSIKNLMVGPQAGVRIYKMNERWVIASEARVCYSYNQQWFAEFGIDDTVQANRQEFSENSWVPSGDLRLEATYKFTKAMALTVGGEMLYFGSGLARGAPPFNDQNCVVAGVTFGFTVNR